MKNIYFFSLIVITQTLLAQQQNALHFDGFSSSVAVTNASSLIANQTEFSISGWVEPTNTNPGFPNFDGVMGFRNEMNCDFYILQLSATEFEGRFRNSANQVFTITSNTLLLNTWQHVALVYDGTQLSFYHNGVLSHFMPASGSITNTSETFFMGRLEFQSTPFMFGGKLDEVAIWNKGLSTQEVGCIYQQAINPADTALGAYYSMNQGIANGNNTQITHLIDQAGSLNGQLTGFQLNGTTSNFVEGINQMTQVYDTICKGDTLHYGGQIFTDAGIYTIFTSLSVGCDSAVQLYLFTDSVDIAVLQNGPVLTALASNVTYQWVDCDNDYQILPDDTLQIFTATQNGQYAVIISDGNCIDTSACYTVNTIGTTQYENLCIVRLYPNPADNIIIVESEMPATKIEIYTASGQLLRSEEMKNRIQLDVSLFASGLYFAVIEGSFGKKPLKFYVN